MDEHAERTDEAHAAGPEWYRVSDCMIAGLCHELNDRIASLQGILHIARLDGAVDSGIADQLDAELERLARTSRLLRLLPADRTGPPVATSPADVLADVLELQQHCGGLEDVPVDADIAPDTPPVFADPASLRRVLALFLASAARAARVAGGTVRLHTAADDDDVLFDVAVLSGADEAKETAPPAGVEPDPLEIAAAGAALRAMGGELDDARSTPPRLRIRLPSLAAIRRREGRG